MKQVDLSKVRVTSVGQRHSKVDKKQLAVRIASGSISDFIDSLPDQLRAADLKSLIKSIVKAHNRKKPIIWMFGAHLIKVGLSPVVCEMIGRGVAQQISTNNAGLIHDLELAFFGSTSEDVEATLADGTFGMSQETAVLYSGVVEVARENKIGLGEAAGRFINHRKAKYRNHSVFAVAERYNVPATVHVAIGTDIVNCHPSFDGAAVGEASQIDFKIFCHNVCRLKNGGVALNFGSAVLMPEVFLKALAIARNFDPKFSRFVAANFDMITHYRPSNNIVKRPRLLGATTYDFAGHHEIMLPLLWAGVREKI